MIVKNRPWQEGDTDARICIIGEAPGGVEVAQGRPLVGPSGRLFNECLHEADIRRADCYILNLFDRRLTRDRLGKNIFDQDGELVWTSRAGFTAAADPYFARFAERLGRSRANVFVPMGGLPLEALADKTQVTKWRGSILPSTFWKGRKVIGTIHPAACLRGNYTWKYLITNDFEKAKRHSAFPELRLPKRNLIIEPSFPDVMAFLRSMNEGKYVNTDIEITNRQISCISFANSPHEAMSIPLMRTMNKSYWGPETETKIWRMISRVLSNPKTKKVNQNILFDLHVLWFRQRVAYQGTLCDPMIAHHCIYPDFKKGLDLICSVCTDEPYYKDEGKTWKYVKDWPQFWRYNARDSAVALECWLELEPVLEAEGYQATYDLHIKQLPWMMFMMDDGMAVDRDRFKYVDAKVDKELEELQAEFERRVETPFNWRSAKQCKEYFYELKGIKPYVSTKTRKPTTDDKALARIARRYNLHEARLIQQMRGLAKFKGSYLELEWDEDDYFRCSVNPRGTKNGRASTQKTVFGTGSNMQNLPTPFQDFLTVDREPQPYGED